MKMSAITLRQMEERAIEAEAMIVNLHKQLGELKTNILSSTLHQEEHRLKRENELLSKDIEVWKQKLIGLEVKNGIQQITLPGEKVEMQENNTQPSPSVPVVEAVDERLQPAVIATGPEQTPKVKELKKEKKTKEKSKGESEAKGKTDEQPIDIGRLDLRIGKIVSVKKHPDADSLYVEEVDLGEENPRTVVSGLVKHVPIQEMENKLVMLLCNLKPAKMRGVLSQAMVMCASTVEKVEILQPPLACVPGDLVVCPGYSMLPDKELNPKKKIFEQIAPDLKTDGEKKACYKGAALEVAGKGFIIAPTLCNVQIK